MTIPILQTTKHTAKMLSVVMLLSFLAIAPKAEIPETSIVPAEDTFLTVVTKAEVPETSAIPSKNSGNCECLKSDPCFTLLKNCVDTASEAYEDGRSSEEVYVMFILRWCPDGFANCVYELYGLE